MEFTEYMKIKRRMVKMQKGGKCALSCNTCPLEWMNNGVGLACFQLEASLPEKALEIVKQWAKEHPAKTYAQDFFEKHPNAHKYRSGTPKSCRQYIYDGCCSDYDNCTKCWNEQMEGES